MQRLVIQRLTQGIIQRLKQRFTHTGRLGITAMHSSLHLDIRCIPWVSGAFPYYLLQIANTSWWNLARLSVVRRGITSLHAFDVVDFSSTIWRSCLQSVILNWTSRSGPVAHCQFHHKNCGVVENLPSESHRRRRKWGSWRLQSLRFPDSRTRRRYCRRDGISGTIQWPVTVRR